MALLNFLKRRQSTNHRETILPVYQNEASIAGTAKLLDLFTISKDKRDHLWQHRFYACVQTAIFTCADEKIITGPDGFRYFVLQTAGTNSPAENCCLHDVKAAVIEQGIGIIINDVGENTGWVFSHGDIVNLYLNNEFVLNAGIADVQHIDMTKKLQVIKKGEDVMIGQPSERYVPKSTRLALRKFLKSKGIPQPKTMLLCRKSNGAMIQEIGINIHPENFDDQAEMDFLLQQVGWFLPKHYLLICFSKHADMIKHFADL
jgi:hypothetical protein